jgi:hypothetical protein
MVNTGISSGGRIEISPALDETKLPALLGN